MYISRRGRRKNDWKIEYSKVKVIALVKLHIIHVQRLRFKMSTDGVGYHFVSFGQSIPSFVFLLITTQCVQ